MTVRIQLDTEHSHYTNLDFISGRIILNLSNVESVSSIMVKLEGESKTRLAPPRTVFNDRSDRKTSELEYHKILYRTHEVFPKPEVKAQSAGNAAYALQAGQHEYPFQFKLPFNTSCAASNSLYSNLNFTGARMEFARDTDRHVINTLPPSLSGFRGEAAISYYVKVTVVRPQFFKENHRARVDFKFLPIEPPRPSSKKEKEETYARRQHQFTTSLISPPKKKGLFTALQEPKMPPPPDEPPRFSVDARLPSPPILTCFEPLPLRILVQKLSQCLEAAYLRMFQIELIGYTDVRAHQLKRQESTSWVIVSLSNLAIPVGNPSDPVGTETPLDDKMWKDVSLPNTIAPSFNTCNISRSYQLEVRVGLSYGSSLKDKPELIILPLRHTVEVYSGIAPPRQLLDKMGHGQHPISHTSKPPLKSNQSQAPLTPFTPSGAPSSPFAPSNPPRLGEVTTATGSDIDAAPPPSYEDAIAEDIGPVDGHRPEYDVPPLPPRDSSRDKQRPGARGSNDRLFPDSGPGPPPFGAP
ncbi:MAG: hypothetical protein M1833_005605 [Piccolia ochrophora]|nr:MAG: hypothetical protein M1833_005605 [Piccolia ochrophora]